MQQQAGKTPHTYQKIFAQKLIDLFLASKPGTIVAHTCGSGKTLMTCLALAGIVLGAAPVVVQKNVFRMCVVVVPRNVLDSWHADLLLAGFEENRVLRLGESLLHSPHTGLITKSCMPSVMPHVLLVAASSVGTLLVPVGCLLELGLTHKTNVHVDVLVVDEASTRLGGGATEKDEGTCLRLIYYFIFKYQFYALCLYMLIRMTK